MQRARQAPVSRLHPQPPHAASPTRERAHPIRNTSTGALDTRALNTLLGAGRGALPPHTPGVWSAARSGGTVRCAAHRDQRATGAARPKAHDRAHSRSLKSHRRAAIALRTRAILRRPSTPVTWALLSALAPHVRTPRAPCSHGAPCAPPWPPRHPGPRPPPRQHRRPPASLRARAAVRPPFIVTAARTRTAQPDVPVFPQHDVHADWQRDKVLRHPLHQQRRHDDELPVHELCARAVALSTATW